MRQWADPTALERLALWGEGSIPTSGAGPAARHLGYDTLQTDGYVHRVGQIAAWPRIDVATEWMYPLLSTALPGSVRTVSMHLEAVSTAAGLRRGPRRPDDGRDGAAQTRREGHHHHRRRGTAGRRGPLARTRAHPGVPPAQDRRPRHGVEPRRRDRSAGLAPGRAQGGRVPPRPPRTARPGSRGVGGHACRCAGSASLGGCSDAAPRPHVGHDPPLGLRLPVPVPGRAALGRPGHRPGGARSGHVLLRPVLPLRHRDLALSVHVGLGQQGLRQVRLRQGLPAPPVHGRQVAGHLGPQG